MSAEDVPACVEIHLSAFFGFFLTFLGPRFLSELYRAIIEDSSGIAFVAEGNAGIAGFVAGTTQLSGFYRKLIRRRLWRFALASIGPFIRRPGIFRRLIRALRAPREATQEAGRGTLMSIGVLPETAGQGIGKALVREFLAEAGRRGLARIDLTTDRERNEDVNAFYRSLGFTWERTFMTPEGRSMNEYVLDVGKER